MTLFYHCGVSLGSDFSPCKCSFPKRSFQAHFPNGLSWSELRPIFVPTPFIQELCRLCQVLLMEFQLLRNTLIGHSFARANSDMAFET